MEQDFVHDQNPTAIYHADQQHGLPEYIKQAQFLEPADVEDLHDAAFADRANRLHPINSKVAALLSGVYLAGNGETEGPVWDAVKSACDHYGATEDLDTLSATFNEPKEAGENTPTEKYAVQVAWNEEETGEYYPINNADEVKEAAVALDQDFNRGKMPIEVFRAGAVNIVKAAAEHNVPITAIPHTVQDGGERRVHNLDYADLMLYTRKTAGVNDEGMGIYRQCITIAKEAGTDEAVDQAVSLWRDLDEQHGLDYRKVAGDTHVPSPYECFYTGMSFDDIEKAASDHVILKGVMIPENEFRIATTANDYETINREFGKEAAIQVIDALNPLNHSTDMAKAATDTSNNLAELPDWQQKRLLKIAYQTFAGYES